METNTTSLDLSVAAGVANSLGYSQYAAIIDTFGLITGLSAASTGPTNAQIMNAIESLSAQTSDIQNKTNTIISTLGGIKFILISDSQKELTDNITQVNNAYYGYRNLFRENTESGAAVDMATFIKRFAGTKTQAIASIYNILNSHISFTDHLDAITNVTNLTSSNILGIINSYQSYLQDSASQVSWLKSDFFQFYQNYAQLISGDIVDSIVAIEQARSYSLAIVEYNYKYANTIATGDLSVNIDVSCKPLTNDMDESAKQSAYNSCIESTNDYYNNLESVYGAATQLAVNRYNDDTVNSDLEQVNQSWYNQWKQTCIPDTPYAKNIVAGGSGLIKDDGYTISEYCPALKTSSEVSNCGSGPNVNATIDGHGPVFWDSVTNTLKCQYVNQSGVSLPTGSTGYFTLQNWDYGDYHIHIDNGITNMWLSNGNGNLVTGASSPYLGYGGNSYSVIFMDSLNRYFYFLYENGKISLSCPSGETGYCNDSGGRNAHDGYSTIQFYAASGSCTIYRLDGGGKADDPDVYIHSLPCDGNADSQSIIGGDWIDSCDVTGASITNENGDIIVQASCKDTNGAYQSSAIDVSKCGGKYNITNRNGVLMCDSDSKPANVLGGNWIDSCAYVKYDPSPGVLSAFCGDGGNNMTSINISSCGGRGAQNDHGVLKCN